jgi:hypothetical protein
MPRICFGENDAAQESAPVIFHGIDHYYPIAQKCESRRDQVSPRESDISGQDWRIALL